MTTVPSTAAQRRAILANAHAAYMATADKGAAKVALYNVLVEGDHIASTDQIMVRMNGTTIEILVDADDFVECLELDAYGNTLKGTV
jgi:hypothetical protein